MEIFLDIFVILNLKKLMRPKASYEIEAVFEIFQLKISCLDEFTTGFYQTFKRETKPMLLKLF